MGWGEGLIWYLPSQNFFPKTHHAWIEALMLSPLAVASWGLLEGAGNTLSNTAASWGLLGDAPEPGEAPAVVRMMRVFQAFILGII